jgi:hypothetical protein
MRRIRDAVYSDPGQIAGFSKGSLLSQRLFEGGM